MKKSIDFLIINEGQYGNKSTSANLNKLINIIMSIEKNIFIITYCRDKDLENIKSSNIIMLKSWNIGIVQFIMNQIIISMLIMRLNFTKGVKTVVFSFGQDLALLPMITSKILKIKTIIRSDGRPSLADFHINVYIKKIIFRLMEEINYRLTNILLTESDYMIKENNMQKYNAKSGNMYVNTESFKITKEIDSRYFDIGFIGRLEEVKGIYEFLYSIKYIDKSKNILIIGNENKELHNASMLISKIRAMNYNIQWHDWVENNKLPQYLNDVKIIIIPSFHEGLPNLLLEAMSCGCIVLASPVGGIPGIIKHGENGFLLNDNSAKDIGDKINDILINMNKYKTISAKASIYIHQKYSFIETVSTWRDILFPKGKI